MARRVAGAPHNSGHSGGDWIAGSIKRPGALHRALGVKQGKKIPNAKIEKAEHSKNPRLAAEAREAETLKGFHKK